jgi:hypothetical protein
LHTSTWLLRRGKPLKWELFKASSFGDYPLLVWTLLQGKGQVLPRLWSLYRIHQQGVFSPLSNEIRVQENVVLWKCLKSIVPPDLEPAVEHGISRTLIMYIAELRKARQYAPALACFWKTLAQVSATQSSAAERGRLWVLTVEALVFPRLIGLRRRLRECGRQN